MLAYPLALLYIFEWAGYQEEALPKRDDASLAFVQFTDHRVYGLLALVLLVIGLLVSLRIEQSRFGLSLLAIKQNEPAAEAAGINTWAWKMRAIMVSGAIGSTVGGLYAVVLLVVTPNTVFGVLTSALALVVVLFGGVGTLWGPVIGAAILIPLSRNPAGRVRRDAARHRRGGVWGGDHLRDPCSTRRHLLELARLADQARLVHQARQRGDRAARGGGRRCGEGRAALLDAPRRARAERWRHDARGERHPPNSSAACARSTT